MSERDLTVADVGEGPEVECRLEARFEVFSMDPQWSSWFVKFIVRLRCFWCGKTHVTNLTRVKIWPLHSHIRFVPLFNSLIFNLYPIFDFSGYRYQLFTSDNIRIHIHIRKSRYVYSKCNISSVSDLLAPLDPGGYSVLLLQEKINKRILLFLLLQVLLELNSSCGLHNEEAAGKKRKAMVKYGYIFRLEFRSLILSLIL